MFDNDGTLWCEKPMPIQLDFILRRLVAMAAEDPALAERQPWKAAAERDYAWFGRVLAEHYAGDDTQLPALAGGILGAFADISVDEFAAAGRVVPARHARTPRWAAATSSAPTPRWCSCSATSQENGFTTYIVSGGGRDFMRPITAEVYGVPSERVIGSATALAYVPRRAGRHDRAEGGGRLPRRRAGEAGAHLEPHRAATRCSPAATPTATSRCSTGPGTRPADAAAARAARRRRARVRLRVGVGEGARARRRRRLDRRERQGRLGDASSQGPTATPATTLGAGGSHD